MAMFFAAVLSDLTSRSVSFLIDKLSTAAIATATLEETLSSLERLLLRVHVVVEEAERRDISNQAMLRQLDQMRKEMYRGYRTLDTFRCRDHHEETAKDHSQDGVMVLPSSSTPSTSSNPAKRPRLSGGGGGCLRERERLRQVLVGLEVTRGEERTLVIIELTGDIDGAVWQRFYSDCTRHVASGSKIIVASRSGKIVASRSGKIVASLGTTRPLRVDFFTPEAYWYFFKARTFGSADARDHPKLASIAMDLAREMSGCFFGAAAFSGLLRADFDARFWSTALATVREFKRVNLLLLGDRCADLWQTTEPVFLRRVDGTSSEYLVIEGLFIRTRIKAKAPR